MSENKLQPGPEEENTAEKSLENLIISIQKLTSLVNELKTFFSEEDDVWGMISQLVVNYEAIQSNLNRIKELLPHKFQTGQGIIAALNKIETYLQFIKHYWSNIHQLWQEFANYLKKHRGQTKNKELSTILQNISSEQRNFRNNFLAMQRQLGYNK